LNPDYRAIRHCLREHMQWRNGRLFQYGSIGGCSVQSERSAEQITQDLLAAIKQAVPGVTIGATSPGNPPTGAGIALALLGAAPRATPLARDRKRSVLALDYLVAIRLGDPLTEHRALCALAFAMLEAEGYEIVGEVAVADACRAVGWPPCTGLVVRVEAVRERALPQAPLVRFPAITTLAPLAAAEGQVLGPGDVPIAGAVVTLAGHERSMTTGPDGRFRFAVPDGTAPKVAVRARGRRVEHTLATDRSNPIPFPMEA
jgi:hypothetical protein